MSLTQIVKTFNEENVRGSIRSAKGWSPATISRILDNEKYAGRWIWNKDRKPAPSEDWAAAAVREARVRMGHRRGQRTADHSEATLGNRQGRTPADAPHREQIAYVLQQVEREIAKLRSDLPEALKLKEAELTAEHRRLANFVDFICEGRGSQALAKPWWRRSAVSTS
jgi:hypothetical protein